MALKSTSASYFVNTLQTNPKFYTERQKAENSQHDTAGEEQSQRSDIIQLPDLLESYGNQVSEKEQTNRSSEQNKETRNRPAQIESTGLDKGAQAIRRRKGGLSANGAGKMGHPHVKKKIYTDLTPFTKINPKWIRDLNVKCETLKLLESNGRESLGDLEFGNDF